MGHYRFGQNAQMMGQSSSRYTIIKGKKFLLSEIPKITLGPAARAKLNSALRIEARTGDIITLGPAAYGHVSKKITLKQKVPNTTKNIFIFRIVEKKDMG